MKKRRQLDPIDEQVIAAGLGAAVGALLGGPIGALICGLLGLLFTSGQEWDEK